MVVVVKLMLSVGWWNTFAVGAVVPDKSDFYYSQARSDMATIDLNETNIQDTISKDGTVIIDFWAPWCGPCRGFAPIFEKSSEAHPDVVFGKVNTEDEQGIGGVFEIQSIPTLVVFRDGIPLYRHSGALQPQDLETLLSQVAALDMDEVRQKVAEATGNAEESE